MTRARLWTVVAMAALVGLCWAGLTMAQPATPPSEGGDAQPRGDRQRPSPEDMRARMEEWRKRAADQLRQNLGASEDEWKVLEPLIQKVQNLQRASRRGTTGSTFGFGGFGGFGGTPGGGFGGRGRGDRGSRDANSSTAAPATPPAPTNPDGTPRELTKIEKAMNALNDVLKNKDASPTQIAEALAALRAARAESQQELTQARKELQEVCTPGQEAKLVIMGILE